MGRRNPFSAKNCEIASLKVTTVVENALTGIFYADDCQIVGYLPGTGKYPCVNEFGTEIILMPLVGMSYELRACCRSPHWTNFQ